MPQNYDGRPGQITTEAALTVTAASNTNPITITVSGALPASFFLSGYGGNPAAPTVDITGVQGNTAANGQFVASPTGASTFTIPVAGNGAYTSGGSVQPLNLKSLYTLPIDGDADNSASIATWGQAMGDRSQFLAARLGYAKLTGRIVLSNSWGPANNWAHNASNMGAGTWHNLTVDDSLNVAFSDTGSLSSTLIAAPAAVAVYGFTGLNAGLDILKITLETNAAGGDYLGLWYALTVAGAAVPSFPSGAGAPYTLLGARAPGNVALTGYLGHPAGQTLYLAPAVYSVAGGTPITATVTDTTTLTVEAWRLTSMPQ